MTPEEIARRNAARSKAGELGEAVARSKPPVYVNSSGVGAVGAQPTGTAMVPRQPAQALATIPPKPGTAMATTSPQAAPEVRSTARPVPRPQPTITVNSQGVASTLDQRTTQAQAQRMAAERAARVSAMKAGGVDALNQEIAKQTGTNPATGRTVGAAPSSAPAAAPSAPAAPASAPAASAAQRAGQAAGSATRATMSATGKAARFGAQPVQPGNPRAGGAAVTALAALPSAAQSAGTPTDQYYERLMIDPKTVDRDGITGMAKDAGVRALGVMSDFGANILDVGTSVWNAGAALAGSEPIPTFNEMLREQDGQYQREPGIIETAIDNGASKLADVIGTGEQPTAQQQPAQQPVAQQPAAQQQPAGQDPNKVLGTFNGRPITAAQAQELAAVNVVAPQAAPEPRAAAVAGRQDNGQGQLLAMLNQARGDRQGVQSESNKRLSELYGRFNDLMSRGKRRSAAVVGDLIGKELGLIQGTAQGQVIDPRVPTTNPAEDQRAQALTEGVQIDNRAKRLAQQSLEAYLADPTSDAGKQALARYQAATGAAKNDEYVYERLMGPDGGESIVAINKRNPSDARAVQPQQAPAVGTVVEQDGKKYVWNGTQYLEQK